MLENNIVGFKLSGELSQEELNNKLDSLVKNYDATVELRQKELEDKLNELVLEFQKKENVVVAVKYNVESRETKPISLKLIAKQDLQYDI